MISVRSAVQDFAEVVADRARSRGVDLRPNAATGTPTDVGCPACGSFLWAVLEVRGRPVNPVGGPVVATVTVRTVYCQSRGCGFRETYDS
jgi:hypothetical protein